MRLFTALEMPPHAHEELARVQGVLRARAEYKRWQALHQAHVTLHFLGEVDESLLPAIQDACRLAAAGHAPFSLGLSGLGAFPNTHKAGVLWVGLGGDLEALGALQADGQTRLGAAGVVLENRRYSPHVTLAREPKGQLDWEAMTNGLEVAPCTWRVERFLLFHSTLTAKGAIHQVVGEFPLASR